MPPQVITDSSVETVREAQEGTSVPVEKFQEARAVLKKQAKSRKLHIVKKILREK